MSLYLIIALVIVVQGIVYFWFTSQTLKAGVYERFTKRKLNTLISNFARSASVGSTLAIREGGVELLRFVVTYEKGKVVDLYFSSNVHTAGAVLEFGEAVSKINIPLTRTVQKADDGVSSIIRIPSSHQRTSAVTLRALNYLVGDEKLNKCTAEVVIA